VTSLFTRNDPPPLDFSTAKDNPVVRAFFSEYGSLYRSYVDLKSKLATIFVAVNAGFVVAYWQTRVNASFRPFDKDDLILRFAVTVFCALCLAIDLRIQRLINIHEARYLQCGNELLGSTGFIIDHLHSTRPLNPLRHMIWSVFVFVVAVAVWWLEGWTTR
jgi:hypothetical protein